MRDDTKYRMKQYVRYKIQATTYEINIALKLDISLQYKLLWPYDTLVIVRYVQYTVSFESIIFYMIKGLSWDGITMANIISRN